MGSQQQRNSEEEDAKEKDSNPALCFRSRMLGDSPPVCGGTEMLGEKVDLGDR